jgi:hypothetical protein
MLTNNATGRKRIKAAAAGNTAKAAEMKTAEPKLCRYQYDDVSPY